MSQAVVVDIGNTRTSFALTRGSRIERVHHVSGDASTKRVTLDRTLTEVASGRKLEGSVLCSVVPEATAIWTAALEHLTGCPPVQVSHKIRLGIKVRYPDPASIGGDRLANACAAAYRYGTPVIVADFGTALTFDVISEDGAYIGGVIAPGLPLMTDYLAEKTALLPKIALRGSPGKIGRTTVSAMRIGAAVGYRGMVREIVEHLKEGMGVDNVALRATGGYAKWALRDSNMQFTFDPNITLYGLTRIYQLNRGTEDDR